jgi:hypothetical protein
LYIFGNRAIMDVHQTTTRITFPLRLLRPSTHNRSAMSFQPDPAIIRWRIHLASPPVQVYQLLATDEGC